jgi:SAM-dependent methyltransferase
VTPPEKSSQLASSVLFILASLLTGLMSALAFASVYARSRKKRASSENLKAGFLADKQRALNFYKVFSAAYDTLNPHLYTDRMRSEIASQIGDGPSLRVLDVGCGTGYTTRGILKRANVAEAIGLDMTPVQLGRASKNLRSSRARVSLYRGDVENLPFRDQSFDAVVSVGAIEYFPNPQKALKEMARVAKPNGAVVVCGPEWAWFGKLGLDRVFYTPSEREVEGFFRGAGLVGVRSVLTGVDTFFWTGKYVSVVAGTRAA